MRIATVKLAGEETAAIAIGEHFVSVGHINAHFGTAFRTNLLELMKYGQLEQLNAWCNANTNSLVESCATIGLSREDVILAPLYRHPGKIWGIGLNYQEHAADLGEQAPRSDPASFMKPDTTIIGIGEPICIPVQSQRTTAEAELAVIIGKRCKNVSQDTAEDFIAGYTTVIDVTAEDILRQNPRYLTRAKSFDTFFSFGSILVTPEEIDSTSELEVSTVINEVVHRKNTVSNMTFSPRHLVSFHSHVMTLLPGDVISTGTPGAAAIKGGDRVSCLITGFEPLHNPVIDLKNT